jgi:hypothetical protein
MSRRQRPERLGQQQTHQGPPILQRNQRVAVWRVLRGHRRVVILIPGVGRVAAAEVVQARPGHVDRLDERRVVPARRRQREVAVQVRRRVVRIRHRRRHTEHGRRMALLSLHGHARAAHLIVHGRHPLALWQRSAVATPQLTHREPRLIWTWICPLLPGLQNTADALTNRATGTPLSLFVKMHQPYFVRLWHSCWARR